MNAAEATPLSPERRPRRSLKDLLLARADGEEVSDAELRTFRREDDLIRALIAYPKALSQSGISIGLLAGPDYKRVWEAAQRVNQGHVGDGPLDRASVLAELRRAGDPRFLGNGGSLFMHALTSQPPVSVGYALDTLVPEVIRLHQLRTFHARLSSLGERIQTDPDPSVLHSLYLTEAVRIVSMGDGGRIAPTTSGLLRSSKPVRPMIRTGVDPIDLHAGGQARGALTVIGGGTHVGKSFFAQRLARNQARLGQPVLYFSAEDPAELFLCRTIADYACGALTPLEVRKRIESQQLRVNIPGAADPLVMQSAVDAMVAEQGDLVYVLEDRACTVSQVCAAIRRHRYVAGVELVIVDYLQAIRPDPGFTTGNKVQETARIVEILRDCATECGVGLVLFSQFARDEYRDGAEPTINSCKWAGDIENVAQIMILLWRDGEDTLHMKIPKIKWGRAALRYVIPTDPISGVYYDAQEDHSVPTPPAARTRGGGGKGRGQGTGP